MTAEIIETISKITDSETQILQANPTWNYGATTILTMGVGGTGASYVFRTMLRFKIPLFSGTLRSQKLKLHVNTLNNIVNEVLKVYLCDSPQDDLWIEGTSNGAVDPYGVDWDRYAKDNGWDTAGGDFGDNPIALFPFDNTLSGYFEIEIPMDNFSFQSGKTYSLFLVLGDEDGIGINIQIDADECTLELGIARDEEIITPEITVEAKSSTELEITFNNPEIEDYELDKYEIWQSDTGVFGGEQTLLTTITEWNDNGYNYIHTGLVVQGDVDDFDPSLDTYPNGRIKYYRLTTYTLPFGNYVSSINSNTTIPAMRPVKLIFSLRSKFYDQEYTDPNQTLPPYGVQIGLEWTDASLMTELEYIAQTFYEAYFKNTGVGWGAFDESDTQDFNGDMVDAAQVEGDIGYVPYKIKGKVFDTGGLYRKATTDKIVEQFEITWPTPCPVAIPLGATRASLPPDLKGAPYDGGEVVIDLSGTGQQSGADIENEAFLGTASDKWFLRSLIGGGQIAYTGGYLRAWTNLVYQPDIRVNLKVKDYDSTPANYNPDAIITKYTGAYHLRKTMMIGVSGAYNSNDLVGFSFCHLGQYTGAWAFPQLGYFILMWGAGASIGMELRRANNISASPINELLLSLNLGSMNPMYTGDTPLTKYTYWDIYISPLFDKTGVITGDRILFVYNKNSVKITAETIDWDTHPYIWVVDSTTREVGEQINYTGTYSFEGIDLGTKALDLRLYKFEINGRPLSVLGSSFGYGVKNITTGEDFNLKSTTPRSFPIFCEPDQLAQTVYVEGRVKNSFGAQTPNNSWGGIKGSLQYQGGVVNNLIPIGFLSVPRVGYKNADVTIDASQSIDPEGGSLIYKFDFGDGSSILETTESVIVYQYSSIGTYTIKLKVEDEAAQESVEVQSNIRIYDAIEQFEEITLLSPWESIEQTSPSGSSKTSHPELDYDTVQNMEGGNRTFSLKGIHHDPDCSSPLPDRIQAAEEERDYIHFLYNKGLLITLDLVNFGKVKGVIIDHKASMDFNDQQAIEFSMVFQEVDVRQFE